MWRRIETRPRTVTLPGGRTLQRPADSYLDRVAKYIPAEVMALYTAASASAASFLPDHKPMAYAFQLFAIAFGLAATYFWMRKATADPLAGEPPQTYAVVISCVIFVLWAFASAPEALKGHTWADYRFYAFALPFVIFIAALYEPKE